MTTENQIRSFSGAFILLSLLLPLTYYMPVLRSFALQNYS